MGCFKKTEEIRNNVNSQFDVKIFIVNIKIVKLSILQCFPPSKLFYYLLLCIKIKKTSIGENNFCGFFNKHSEVTSMNIRSLT